MTEKLKWMMWHVAHWGVLFGAFAEHLDGAMYVLKFMVWVTAPLSLVLLSDVATKEATKKPPPHHVQAAMTKLQSWITLGLLVWFGHIASATAWVVAMAMTAIHRDAVRKARAAATEAQ